MHTDTRIIEDGDYMSISIPKQQLLNTLFSYDDNIYRYNFLSNDDAPGTSLCNNRLKKLRHHYGLSQLDLATILNVTTTEYQRIEKDGHKIAPARLFFLSVFYNVSLDYIFGLIPEPRKLSPYPTSFNGYNLERYIYCKNNGIEYDCESTLSWLSTQNDIRNYEIIEEMREDMEYINASTKPIFVEVDYNKYVKNNGK